MFFPQKSARISCLTHPLVNLPVLELHEPGRYGRDVALLVGEGDPAGPLGVLELRVGVDTRVADPAVQTVHYHGKLNWNEGANMRQWGQGGNNVDRWVTRGTGG